MEPVKIEFIEDRANGLRHLSVGSWSCGCFVVSYSGLESALKTEKLDCPGVYILVGPSEVGSTTSGRPTIEWKIYVGQSDALDERLYHHYHSKNKGFWSTAFAFHGMGPNLNPTQLTEFEALLIQRVGVMGQADSAHCHPTNKIQPSTVLNVRDEAEVFLRNTEMILQAVGFDFLSHMEAPKDESTTSISENKVKVPDSLRNLVNEIRNACLDLPSTEFYETRVPDLRARVVSGEHSRIFARLLLTKKSVHLHLHCQPKLYLVLGPNRGLDPETKQQINAAYSQMLHELKG